MTIPRYSTFAHSTLVDSSELASSKAYPICDTAAATIRNTRGVAPGEVRRLHAKKARESDRAPAISNNMKYGLSST